MNTSELIRIKEEYGYSVAVEVLTEAMHNGEFVKLYKEALARLDDCAEEEELYHAVQLTAREYVTLLSKKGDLT